MPFLDSFQKSIELLAGHAFAWRFFDRPNHPCTRRTKTMKFPPFKIIKNTNWRFIIATQTLVVRRCDVQINDPVALKPSLLQYFTKCQSGRFQFDLQCVSPQSYDDPGWKSTSLDLVPVMLHHTVWIRLLVRGHGR